MALGRVLGQLILRMVMQGNPIREGNLDFAHLSWEKISELEEKFLGENPVISEGKNRD